MLSLCASLLMFSLHLSTADETYVTCLNCHDVSSPSACKQNVTCGKGEVCYAKQYTDHKGLTAFRLGCEDQTRCNLFLDAKLIVGKRDVAPAPSDICYDCCIKDECNGRLCPGGGGSHVTSGFHSTQGSVTTTGYPACSCPNTTTTTTTCPACTYQNTTSTTTTCPGCTYQNATSTTTTCPACTYQNATSTTTCPACAYQNATSTTTTCPACTYQNTTSTTTTCPACTCPKTTCPAMTHCPLTSTNACPEYFIPHNNSCYMFGTWNLNWTAARTYCKARSADLVSISSQDEQDFLVKQLNVLATKSIEFLNTGGAYSQSFQQWEWADRSPFQYTNWQSGYPGTPSDLFDYYIVLSNPFYSSTYKTGLWFTATSRAYAFICEKRV